MHNNSSEQFIRIQQYKDEIHVVEGANLVYSVSKQDVLF